MQVNVKLFGEDGKRILIPMEIFRMKEYILSQLGSLMQVFGLSEVTLTVTDKNLFPAVSIGFDTFTTELPQILVEERPEIIRGVFKTMMERFGIQSIKITPEAAELDKLKQYWLYVKDGSTGGGDIPVKGPLPQAAIDPTNQPVVAAPESPLGDLGEIVEGPA